MQTYKGTIGDTYLPDAMGLICQPDATGVLSFSNGPHKAKVFVQNGHIIHAMSTSGAKGMAALEEVTYWSEGGFVFDTQDLPPGTKTTINRAIQQTLRGLAMRADEWVVLKPVLEDIHRFPFPAMLPGEDLSALNSRERRMLEYINGYYSIEELATAMREPLPNIAKTLYGLVTQEHVIIKGVRAATPPVINVQAQAPSTTLSVLDKQDPAVAPPFAQPAAGAHGAGITNADGSPFNDPFASSTGGTNPSISNPASNQDPTHYLALSRQLRDTVKALLPESLHGPIDSIHAKLSKRIMIGEADIKSLKAFGIELSQFAVDKSKEQMIAASTVVAVNQEIKAFFKTNIT